MRRAVLVAALALAAGFGLGAWWAQPAPLSPRDLLSLATQLADARARQAADTYAVAREALVAQQAKPPPRSTGPSPCGRRPSNRPPWPAPRGRLQRRS